MKSSEIRRQFLDFFAQHGHTIVPSSSLIPNNDPTLLFCNSGMVQFKEVFLGTDQRSYSRAVTVQRCMRAGGKHNDLENVGYTARHHTFFEMLGNFSFGDYFKKEAIHYAWELLTKVYQLPAEKLWITVYQEDDEAYSTWNEQIGVPKERIVRIGDNKGARYASDNFWQMADTGPCGPCSEIFYDHGPEVAGGPPGSVDQDGDRYIEIWNLVFMQFNKDANGTLHPLPKPCVDTGMGLERLAAVLQHVHSNYEIDLFQKLINAAGQYTNTKDLNKPSLKVIADHIRASSFLIVDGVIPSNEGRGYVLRRIIRRALRHGYQLGQQQAFFYELVSSLAEQMGQAYPELNVQTDRVKAVLKQEEERFGVTLEQGMKVLEAELTKLTQKNILPGALAFLLYDTYGFPLDLTEDICRERKMTVDVQGFEQAMEEQRAMARSAHQFKALTITDYQGGATQFTGYEDVSSEAKVVAIYQEGLAQEHIEQGQAAIIILDRTPFYAESGGQVGDRGQLSAANTLFAVNDTQKISASVYGHHGVLQQGRLRVGDTVAAAVNQQTRAQIMRNHSATHLLHKALREILGEHVQQKGSLVDASKTRFDFSHDKALTDSEKHKIEAIVNQQILQNAATQTALMSLDDARASGAMCLFNEKYAEQVRVLDIGFSRELCGGTHVERTGDIGLFKITLETAIAAGVRRIEAVTGDNALNYISEQQQQLQLAANAIKVQPNELATRLTQMQQQISSLEKELAVFKKQAALSQSEQLIKQVKTIAGVQLLVGLIEHADVATLRTMLDQLKDRLQKNAVILLVTVQNTKVHFIAGVSKDIQQQFAANELVQFVAKQMGGKGGGRADMAQAGADYSEQLPQVLASVAAWVEQQHSMLA